MNQLPITERAALRRLRYLLSKNGQRLLRVRSKQGLGAAQWVIVDRDEIICYVRDLEQAARELETLGSHERIQGSKSESAVGIEFFSNLEAC